MNVPFCSECGKPLPVLFTRFGTPEAILCWDCHSGERVELDDERRETEQVTTAAVGYEHHPDH